MGKEGAKPKEPKEEPRTNNPNKWSNQENPMMEAPETLYAESPAFSFGISQRTGGGDSPVYEEELEGRDPEGVAYGEGEEDSGSEEDSGGDETTGIYVWSDFLGTYIPAFECDEDEMVAACMPNSDGDAESGNCEGAGESSREGKESAVDTPGRLRVLLHRQTPRATTAPPPARPAGEMEPRGVHSAPPPDQGSIRAVERRAEELKLTNLSSHIYNMYSDSAVTDRPFLSSGVSMASATIDALTQE
ncbi:hypothetical protein CYMTET_34821 [Cymbomonas tetramitiformis]|uniref:Uncharacterized protein n=1 Tax=Cymbomonas tetramitiformis TaxID=36881 RepID=A0AAE0KPH2_9CHLO|nr:hypothetical protein CYMTET_34821 [Cymbomonas tetramitiformis]